MWENPKKLQKKTIWETLKEKLWNKDMGLKSSGTPNMQTLKSSRRRRCGKTLKSSRRKIWETLKKL
jgi:hypothetical protein